MYFAGREKFRQLELLDAALVRRESMLGVQILAGLSVRFVKLESLAIKEKMSVIFARRDNRTTEGQTRVQTVVKDTLCAQEDRCVLSAMQESINLVRRRVKIAQQENFQWKPRTCVLTVV